MTVRCPKEMTHGPCGGVSFAGTCEINPDPCAFLALDTVRWTGVPAPAPIVDPLDEIARRKPLVVSDLPSSGVTAGAVRGVARGLAGHVDAVLFGDSAWHRVQLPPSYRARLVAEEGVRPWAGVNCRDRNRVALEGELCALADIGAAIHCITGDHPAIGHRPDAKPVFDIDSTDLVALAARAGLYTSVAENPVAPPTDRRPERLAEKARAGARVCIVNHPGSAETVTEFIDGARRCGVPESTLFLVCIPVVYSAASLAGLRTFTALRLPEGFAAAIESARNPALEGARRAIDFAEAVLAVRGVAGVDLSVAPGSPAHDTAAAHDVTAALDVIRTIAKELS